MIRKLQRPLQLQEVLRHNQELNDYPRDALGEASSELFENSECRGNGDLEV